MELTGDHLRHFKVSWKRVFNRLIYNWKFNIGTWIFHIRNILYARVFSNRDKLVKDINLTRYLTKLWSMCQIFCFPFSSRPVCDLGSFFLVKKYLCFFNRKKCLNYYNKKPKVLLLFPITCCWRNDEWNAKSLSRFEDSSFSLTWTTTTDEDWLIITIFLVMPILKIILLTTFQHEEFP